MPYLMFYFINFSIQVKEHLEIFAILKGVNEEFVKRVVMDMIDEVSSSLHDWNLACLCYYFLAVFALHVFIESYLLKKHL